MILLINSKLDIFNHTGNYSFIIHRKLKCDITMLFAINLVKPTKSDIATLSDVGRLKLRIG